ncbi:unnamed protein product [Peronospora destructor]|uniref:CNH domain-containing protein n=1 Tax=Peronospora destructor TaxID=86335 RepID=A0AAV0UBU5_9STRA|nr:unnamed protein product [Peronospora destructor]
MSSDLVAYAAGAQVDVDVPLKRLQQTIRLFHSTRASSPMLFIGCLDGTLRSYVIDERTDCVHWQADYKRLFHICCGFLDIWGVFATIIDNRLRLYDLPLFSNTHAVVRNEITDAILFTVYEEAKTLCALIKSNTLKVFDWTVNRALELRAQHEVPTVLLPVQQLLLLSENHVFIQGKKDWIVLNLDNGKVFNVSEDVKDKVNDVVEGTVAVCDAVSLPSRHLTRRRQHVMDLLLCGKHRGVILSISEDVSMVDKDENVCGAFDDDTDRLDDISAGKALDLSTRQLTVKVERIIEYNVAPRNVYFHYPFLLLNQAEQLAVYNFDSLQMIQTISVKTPYGICVASNVASATVGPNRLQFRHDRPATLFTVSPSFEVQMHEMLPIAQQVAVFLGNRRLEDAVALCKLCSEDSPLSDVDQQKLYADYGFKLFRSARRQEAMNYFFESNVDVMEVLQLFPRNLLPRKISALRKDNSSNNKEGALEGDDLVESLLALIGFLRRKRNAYLHHEEESLTIRIRTRRSLGPSDETALELIDTMLVKCLVVVSEKVKYEDRAKRALLEVVTGQNWCEIGEAEIFLLAHRRLKALLAFYSARKLHRKALELLEDLERSAASAATLFEKNETDRKVNEPQSSGDLQSSHDYMVLIAQYLRVLGKKHAELVFEFSRRVLSVNPALGLSIFTQRKIPSAKTDIDPAAVLQHLKSCTIATSSYDWKTLSVKDTAEPSLPLLSSQMLAIEYLTQLIYEGTHQLTPRLHDEVVYLLLDLIQAEIPHNVRLTSRVEAQRDAIGILRRKLLRFLEFPGAVYHPERMLTHTPIEMVDEHAALLSKLGRHHEVLQLYALELKDAVLAEAYCNRCYESKTADSSIYSTLLKLYLRPQCHTDRTASGIASRVIIFSPKSSPLRKTSNSNVQSEPVQAAIDLLNNYAERINVSTALELLPANVAAAPLATFFRRVLECQVQRLRNGQVKKQLSKMENFKVREQLSTKRKGSVTVWSSQCCQFCSKKLDVGTFVRLPNGALLHYSCQRVQ